jgi:hypothetical protein
MTSSDESGPIIWIPDVDEHTYEPDIEGWCVRCGGTDLDPLHSNVWDNPPFQARRSP